jgi:SpoVK/Ycf46/Vps4 family AAA+-type ATPase
VADLSKNFKVLSDVAKKIVPAFTWNDLVLPETLQKMLREIAAHVRHNTSFLEDWAASRRTTTGHGISVLFAGGSGTEKRMAAEVLANDLQLDLYRIDLASVVSKFIGETEKNIDRIFAAAEESGPILFFDEAEALFGKRTEVKDSHDHFVNLELNYLLLRMEDYRGLVILATDHESALDSAFVRRLRFGLKFPSPHCDPR